MRSRPIRTLLTAAELYFLELLLGLLVLLHLIPIWSFPAFPSQDGPIHVANATIFREYNNPERTVFREYYVLNEKPSPNWLIQGILAGLMFLVSPLTAEKILLSGYTVLFPFAIRYALEAIQRGSGFLAVMACIFMSNLFLHMGFYNFCYSLPLYLFFLGYWIKHHHEPRPRHLSMLLVLSLLLYFAHIFSFVAALIAVAILYFDQIFDEIWRHVESWRVPWSAQKRAQERFQRCRASFVWTFGGVLPALILAGFFFVDKGGVSAPSFNLQTAQQRLDYVMPFSSLVSFQPEEETVAYITLYGFGVLVGYVLISQPTLLLTQARPFALIVMVYGCIFFIAPEKSSGGSFIPQRLTLYIALSVILWLGVYRFPLWCKRPIQATASGIVLLFLILHIGTYAVLNDYLQEYRSCLSVLEANTTLLPLSFSHTGRTPDGQRLSHKAEPFRHASGYFVADRSIVTLDNFSAYKGHHPLIYREHLRPEQYIGCLECIPPKVDFVHYAEKTGGRVDYVLMWNVQDKDLQDPYTQSIFEQLEQDYTLIFVSSPRGMLQLYRRKP